MSMDPGVQAADSRQQAAGSRQEGGRWSDVIVKCFVGATERDKLVGGEEALERKVT